MIELEEMTYIDSYSIGHLLFDMKEDPKQNNPLNNEVIENMMKEKLVKKMTEIDTPKSEFIRLGMKG
ncbi:hypothetical protein [Vagococcus fluvialis]|uniref:hypothetical protein n=1 Tax=Vagococcus fluvialis TaxID=2738 RepID=UPI001A8F655F|nr:hypothetical protein [Vagococcus fluvialis]MBO0437199.1 hypothetical protein [Vagococcus fluvialis]